MVIFEFYFLLSEKLFSFQNHFLYYSAVDVRQRT